MGGFPACGAPLLMLNIAAVTIRCKLEVEQEVVRDRLSFGRTEAVSTELTFTVDSGLVYVSLRNMTNIFQRFCCVVIRPSFFVIVLLHSQLVPTASKRQKSSLRAEGKFPPPLTSFQQPRVVAAVLDVLRASHRYVGERPQLVHAGAGVVHHLRYAAGLVAALHERLVLRVGTVLF